MSQSHPYRVQLHCDRQMHSDINQFAEQRGLSQSGAARILIGRALLQKNDEVSGCLDRMTSCLEAILHASVASRILAADAGQSAGSTLSGDQLRERISSMLQRYKQF